LEESEKDGPGGEVEDSAHIDVERLCKLPVVEGLEGARPAGAGVVDEDVELVVRELGLEFLEQEIEAFGPADVGRDVDSSAWDAVDGVELRGGICEVGFVAGGDDDFAGSGLEECGGDVEADTAGSWGWSIKWPSAGSSFPGEKQVLPPVISAVFPSRRKSESKPGIAAMLSSAQ
jgi:hypothetical protein